MKRYRKFIIIYGTACLFISLPFLLNLLFVINAKESLAYSEVIKLQQKENALYGTAMDQSIFPYKLELVKYMKPEILALGSSTIMTMREEFFNKSFVNCGNAMNNLTEGKLFLQEVLKYYRPKLIIFAIDFWWFGNQIEPKTFDYHQNVGSQITFEKLVRPFNYLIERKVTLSDYISIVLSRNSKNKISNYSTIGLRATKRSDGFRKDGSALAGSRIFGFDPSPAQIGFNPAARVRRRFDYGKELSEIKLKRFEEIIQIMNDQEIKFVIIMPPISEDSYKIIHSITDKHIYIEALRDYLKNRPYEIYDFHKISDIGSNNCECIDSAHIGETAYQRVLLTILERNPNSVIKPYVNIGLLKKNIREFSGRVLAVFDTDKDRFSYKEVDFLNIGCKK